MPEITENFIRIPNPKHTESGCQNIRTIKISASKGISGLYCIDHKKIKTYLFLRAKGWTMETAREWVTSHSKGVSMEDIKTEEQLLNELKEKIKEAIYTKAVKEKDEKGDSVFVVSDDVEDREGEVISTEGWKLENYKNYPVLLWSHNPNELLIGHGTNLRYRTINGKKKLTFQPKFHRKSELSRLVGDLVDEDWIRGVSVGFRPIEKEGNVYTKQELLEISFVNVPANPNALSLAFAKGYKEDTIGKVMDVEKAKEMQEKIDKKEKEVEVTKEILEQKKKEAEIIKENPDIKEEKEIKGVIGFKDLGKADEGMAWNAGAEVKKASGDATKLKNMHAWVDSGAEGFNADERQWYKLPHHLGSGGQSAVWRGVAAAMGAILGARGGVQLPEGDKSGVYSHLKKHYAQFDKEAPELKEYIETELKEMFGEEKKPKEVDDKRIDKVESMVKELVDAIKTRDKIIEDNNKKVTDELGKLKIDVKGLSGGELITDRLTDIEANIETLSEGLKGLSVEDKNPQFGDRSTDTGGQKTVRIAMKALNLANEALNKELKDKYERRN